MHNAEFNAQCTMHNAQLCMLRLIGFRLRLILCLIHVTIG
jgi:hypothetical protein